jgi:hypothetical protein
MPILASLAGSALAQFFVALTRVRHPRPIHPHGVALVGEMRWLSASASGISWIDEPPAGPVPVRARLSRSIGVPAPLPDVIGLALRVDGSAGPVDLTFASTGRARFSRFALLPHRSPSAAWSSTILPYRGSRGPVLLAVQPLGPKDLPSDPEGIAETLRTTPWRLRVHAARPAGRWHPFAELMLRAEEGSLDTDRRVDVGRHTPPGATVAPWIAALRDPSYRSVQRRSEARS